MKQQQKQLAKEKYEGGPLNLCHVPWGSLCVRSGQNKNNDIPATLYGSLNKVQQDNQEELFLHGSSSGSGQAATCAQDDIKSPTKETWNIIRG